MAKNNKRQNNALIFNALVNGLSWDQVMEMQDEMKHQDNVKPPTKKDILTDWIVSKDYMLQQQGEQYKKGGHLFWDGDDLDNWDPNAYMQTEDYQNFMNGISGNDNNNSSQDTTPMGSGLFEGINSIAAPAVGGLANSFNYNDYWGNSSEVNKAAYGDSTADPIARLLGNISGTGLKRAKDEIENRRQGNVLNLNYGDNASLMARIEAYNKSKTGKISQLGDLTVGGGITDFLNSTGQGALHGSTILPGWGTLGGAIAGSLSWIGNAAMEGANRKKINAAIQDANNDLIRNDQRIAYIADNNQLLNAFNQLQHMTKNGGKLKKSYKFAEGGLLNTYDYGLEEVNAGGSHEENPNEGVVVSYAPDGLPNKVEEGETIHNDYVYSKRLEANEKVLENNLLDRKYKGKSFADISKKLTEDRKERPNDPISVRTNEENLDRLQNAQEELKLDNKTKEVKRFLGSLNNDQLNALQQEMMDEYEAYAEQQAQQQEAEDQAYQEEQAAQEGMFGRGGHLKQGKYGSSLISASEPIYNEEGKTIGWRTPNNIPTENVLDLSGYNPNYDGAQIYADNRNWFERNITSPWNTWWNNLPSPEFAYAMRYLTPIGIADAIINGDTERLLASTSTGEFPGLYEDDIAEQLQQDRAIDKMWKSVNEKAPSSKVSSKPRSPKAKQPNASSTKPKSNTQEPNNAPIEESKKAKRLRQLKSTGITLGAIGAAEEGVRFGVREAEEQKTRKNVYNSEIPILETDSTQNQQSNVDKYIYAPNSSYWYDPIEGRMFYKKSEGGHLFQVGGFAPYEFEEVNGEVFAHRRNIDRNGNIGALTIPEAEFTPEMIAAYRIWKRRNNSSSSNISTKSTPVKPKSTSTTKSTTASYNNPNYTGLDYMLDSTPINVELPQGYVLGIDPNQFGEFNSDEIVDSNSDFIDYSSRPKANPLNGGLNGKTTTSPRNPEQEPNYLSYLRYAPIIGSLGQVLSDTLGLTNQPDYSNIDMYRRVVDSIGGVDFVPIGGYQQHTPIDREYIANQQLAQAAAYNRSLNNTNPVGSYILGLVNDAKVRDQIGDMYINAAAQDQKDRLAVAEYNRGIDITNARNSLAAQSENARLRAQRANEYQSIANMMNTERNTAEAARAANYQGLFTNIGSLGTDEMNRTMVNRNPALFYEVNLDGSIRFKNAFWGLSEDTQNELIDMLEKQGYKISK